MMEEGLLNPAASRQVRQNLLYEFHTVGLAAAPDHFALIAAGMFRRQRQSKAVANVDRSVSDDLGAARRDVEHGAFAPGFGLAVVEAHKGGPVAQLPSRFALYPASHGHYLSKGAPKEAFDPAECSKSRKVGLRQLHANLTVLSLPRAFLYWHNPLSEASRAV